MGQRGAPVRGLMPVGVVAVGILPVLGVGCNVSADPTDTGWSKDTGDSEDSAPPWDSPVDCPDYVGGERDVYIECVAATKWLTNASYSALAATQDRSSDGSPQLAVGLPGAASSDSFDGVVDLLDVSARGHVREEEPIARIAWDADASEFGRTLVWGDLTSDGVVDLVVGAPSYWWNGDMSLGALYVFAGPITADRSATEADATLIAPYSGPDYHGASPGAGYALAVVGDTNGDGRDDLVTGTYGWGGWLVQGPITEDCPDLDACSAAQFVLGEGDTGYLASSIAGAGDVDGDGLDDLLLADAPLRALIYLGPQSGSKTPADADIRLEGDGSDSAGTTQAALGDTTGDGYPEILVGAQGMADVAGGAYIASAPFAATVDLPSTAAIVIGENPDDRAGETVAAAGDVNGDGLGDMMIGAPDAGRDDGVVYVVLSPVEGTTMLADAPLILRGYGDDETGAALSTAGDVDGDGRDDLLVSGTGDREVPEYGEYAGAVWMVLAADVL